MEQQLRGFASLSSVIFSLEQRYLNGFEAAAAEGEEEEHDSQPDPSTANSNRKRQRARARKLKATKEEEELLRDGEGFVDDSELPDDVEETYHAQTTQPPQQTAAAAPALPAPPVLDLSKLVVTRTKTQPTPAAGNARDVSKLKASGDRNRYIMQHLGDFGGSDLVLERLTALTRCIHDELLDSGGEFTFSPGVERALLALDVQFRAQQRTRSKAYLAQLLSVLPTEVSKDVLVAHMQRLALRDALVKQEEALEVKLKWTADAVAEFGLEEGKTWNGQVRSCVYLVGLACRKAQRARERLEAWLVERRAELAKFSPRHRYRLKPKRPYSLLASHRLALLLRGMDAKQIKQAMDEFPGDECFLDQTTGQYVPFRNPNVVAKAAVAAAQAATLLSTVTAAATTTTTTPLAPANNNAPTSEGKREDTINEVFFPSKGTRYQKMEFKPKDFQVN